MTSGGDILWLEYLPAAQVCRKGYDGKDDTLGGTCFSHPAIAHDPGGFPLLPVDMTLPAGEDGICEIWHCREPLHSRRQGNLHWRQGETLLFGCLTLDEAVGETRLDSRPPLQVATEAAYQSVFELLESLGYNAVLRFWNYFSGINQVTHSMERYRQFNVGRQDAFLSHGHSVIGNVPAACALGSAAGGLRVAFLAAHAEMICIENPRQVSAYHYPSQYGPRSPTFSRACLVNLRGRDMLFISGTASIVGHESLHEGDVAAQTRESLQNIAAVLAEANRRAPSADFRLDSLAYKVYVRRAEDLIRVRHEMMQFIGAPVSAVYLLADVCRADLLVEIEASGGHAVSSLPTHGVRS
jgi:chorismate lyase/3-hydroxybenzoate synthase